MNGKLISGPAAVLVLLLFFLPWVYDIIKQMKQLAHLRLGLWLLLLLPATILAQDQITPSHIVVSETPGDDTPFVNDEMFPAIGVDVTPVDPFGVPITGLMTADFVLQEDGTPIENLTVEAITRPEQSVSLLILLDLGQAMGGNLDGLKTAVINLYTILEQTDESGLIAFSQPASGPTFSLDAPFPQINPSHEMNFTNDEGALTNLINGLVIEEGAGSPLYDGLVKGIRMTTSQARNEFQALILISDGLDTNQNGDGAGSNMASSDIAINEARQLHVPVYSIAVGSQTDAAFLEQASTVSGGAYYPATDGQAISQILAGIVSQLRQSYRLKYRSLITPDNGIHRLNIAVGDGDVDVAVEFRARYPLQPLVRQVTAVSYRQPEPVDLASLVGVQGVVTIQPDVLARSPIQSISYYIDDGQRATYTASAPPWTFKWDTSRLSAGETHKLFIQVLDTNDPPNVGDFETIVFVEACNIVCQTEQSLGFNRLQPTAIFLAILIIVLFFVIRRRPQTAVTMPAVRPNHHSIRPARPPQPDPSNPLDLFRKPQSPPAAENGPPGIKTEVLHESKPIAFLINPQGGQEYRLTAKITIGTEPDNDIMLTSSKIATHHAEIIFVNGEYVVRNLTTAHTTKVNRETFLQRPLKDGDHLKIGDCLLVFRQIR